jgi:hypothetical protein
VKRIAFLALLLVASGAVAAPAPFAKPQRKADRLPVPPELVVIDFSSDEFVLVPIPVGALNAPPPLPPPPAAQPPNADPPG